MAIKLGGEDAKIIFFGANTEERMNGTCEGGIGIFDVYQVIEKI